MRLVVINIFVSNLGVQSRCMLMKFTEDTELEVIANIMEEEDWITLQKELDKFEAKEIVSKLILLNRKSFI